MPKILRDQGYKCAGCKVKHGSTCSKNASSGYTELDDFETAAAMAAGIEVLKIHLRLNFRDGERSNWIIANMFALCPKCTQSHLKSLKRDFKREALGRAAELSMNEIVILKNFFSNELGVVLDTKNAIRLLSLVSNFFTHEYK